MSIDALPMWTLFVGAILVVTLTVEAQDGTIKGTVLYMAPDFDAPLDDFKEYM